MTIKEIANSAVDKIYFNCDTNIGYGAWREDAEEAVSIAFLVARNCKKSVTSVANEILKKSFSYGNRFGECMRMAVVENLASLAYRNMLSNQEEQSARKIIGY